MNIHRTAEDIHIINAVDPSAVRTRFREVLAHFGSGVVVITSIDSSGAPVGMTVGSFTSISIEPPLVGFFAGHNSTTLPHVLGNSEFCVNVLSEDQHSLARVFARSGSDKFEGVDWTPRSMDHHGWPVHTPGSIAPSTSIARSAITDLSSEEWARWSFQPRATRWFSIGRCSTGCGHTDDRGADRCSRPVADGRRSHGCAGYCVQVRVDAAPGRTTRLDRGISCHFGCEP